MSEIELGHRIFGGAALRREQHNKLDISSKDVAHELRLQLQVKANQEAVARLNAVFAWLPGDDATNELFTSLREKIARAMVEKWTRDVAHDCELAVEQAIRNTLAERLK